MGFVVIGRRTLGRIDRSDGSHDATEFFHGNYLPMVPLRGVRVTGGREETVPLQPASVALAYARGWLWLPALFAGVYGFIAPTDGTGLALSILIAVAAVLSLESWLASLFLGPRRWSGKRRLLAALLLTLPVLSLGAALYLELLDHPVVEDHRCANGDAMSCYELGRKAQNGSDYVHRDLGRAAALYARACQGGLTQACKHR